MNTPIDIAIGVGSNIRPGAHVPAGIQALKTHFDDVAVSTLYRCAAVGFDGASFINLVVLARTAAPIQAVQDTLRTIEADNGRALRARDGSRTLDLDLLLYGDVVYDDGVIRVPREDITDYAFVLAPLAELWPQGVHPQRGISYAALWQAADAPDQLLTPISWADLADSD